MTAVWILSGVVALLALAAAALVGFNRLLARNLRRGERAVTDLVDSTHTDARGAVRSIQSAEIDLPHAELERLWTPMYLERLARTYWRFLSRVTLGLIRVEYTDRERFVVLVASPLKLLTFQAPEYELAPDRGVVRWRIERGLLVARRGRGGSGRLQIEVARQPSSDPAVARIRVAVEVSNFYPSIAAGLSGWVYAQTQSRIHVLVTYGFLRSLARRDLAESRVGTYAPRPADVSGASTPAGAQAATGNGASAAAAGAEDAAGAARTPQP